MGGSADQIYTQPEPIATVLLATTYHYTHFLYGGKANICLTFVEVIREMVVVWHDWYFGPAAACGCEISKQKHRNIQPLTICRIV